VLCLVWCLVASLASNTRGSPSTGAGARADAAPQCGAAPPTHRRCPAPPPPPPSPRRGTRTRHAHPPPPPRPVRRCDGVDGGCAAARPSRRRWAGAPDATRGRPAHRPTADAGGASCARRRRPRAPRAATAPPPERSRRLAEPAALAVAPRRDAARRAGGRVRDALLRCRAGAHGGVAVRDRGVLVGWGGAAARRTRRPARPQGPAVGGADAPASAPCVGRPLVRNSRRRGGRQWQRCLPTTAAATCGAARRVRY